MSFHKRIHMTPWTFPLWLEPSPPSCVQINLLNSNSNLIISIEFSDLRLNHLSPSHRPVLTSNHSVLAQIKKNWKAFMFDPAFCHGQDTRTCFLFLRCLSMDGLAGRAIVVYEFSTLARESWDNSVRGGLFLPSPFFPVAREWKFSDVFGTVSTNSSKEA